MHFKPHYRVARLNDLSFRNLHRNGIRYVVFDKDNTITEPYAKNLHFSVQKAVDDCMNTFGKESVAVLSNSIGSAADQPNHEGALEFTELTGIQVIRHGKNKPLV